MAGCCWGRGPHNHIYPGKAHRDDMSAMQNEAKCESHQLWSLNIFHRHKQGHMGSLTHDCMDEKVHFTEGIYFLVHVRPSRLREG